MKLPRVLLTCPNLYDWLPFTGWMDARIEYGTRYDETDILLREYSENDTQTDRAGTSIARINAIHGVYSKEISNADMLYTIGLMITEPMNWIDRSVRMRGPRVHTTSKYVEGGE